MNTLAQTVLIEILDSHGRVQARERVTLTDQVRTFTVGRSTEADITLDDAYAAALHAQIEVTPEGRVLVSDLGTLNGVVIAGKRQRGAQNLELTDGTVQIGRTRLRARSNVEILAPEKPDQLAPASILRDPAWIAGIGALAGTAQLAYTAWLGVPRDLATTIVTTLIPAVLAAGGWIAFWALLSRVMLGEWRWLRHAAIFLGLAAILGVVSALLELGWFAFSLPQWSTSAAWIGAIGFGCALYLHLTNASGISSRRAAWVACLVPALSGGVSLWVQDRYQMRDVNHISASQRIYPPALRLRAAGTLPDYFDSAAALRDITDKKRKTPNPDDEDEDAADDDS